RLAEDSEIWVEELGRPHSSSQITAAEGLRYQLAEHMVLADIDGDGLDDLVTLSGPQPAGGDSPALMKVKGKGSRTKSMSSLGSSPESPVNDEVKPKFTPGAPGVYTFQVVATDEAGNTGSDRIMRDLGDLDGDGKDEILVAGGDVDGDGIDDWVVL